MAYRAPGILVPARDECGHIRALALRADVNLKKIARLMGHSNTKRTERYVHPTGDGLS